MKDYTYILTFSAAAPDREWQIYDLSGASFSAVFGDERKIVFRCPVGSDVDGLPPIALRMKYEELLGRPEFLDFNVDPPPVLNLVEAVADEGACAWDQPCKFGHRVDTHAVYCHNSGWLYAPRKCRRNRTDFLHENCRGFKPNPSLKKE
jgi:hypothetical protein